jgi:aldehyde:ferredoxin oxidoreductase
MKRYVPALFSSGSGVETSEDMLFKYVRKVRNLERAYCVREGMTRQTDSLPKRYMDKPIERGEYKGEILETSKFEEMKSKYYALRGWDIATGIPTKETLEQTGLGNIARDLEKRGKLPKKSPEEAKMGG